VKGRAEATRFKGRFSELIVALIKLAALQVRLGTIATEAAWTFHSKVIQSIGAGDRPMQSAITEEKSMRLRVPLSETNRRPRIGLSMPAPFEFSE
jgi:hypothetical protein